MKKNESLYPELKNKDWLYEKYVTEKRSLNYITKLIQCKSSNSVRQALIRFGIPVRNCSEGLTVNNEQLFLNKEIIDGCLLGDAGLRKYNKRSDNSYALFYKKNVNLDHIEYVAKFFYKNFQNYISTDSYTLDEKTFSCHIFSTRVDKRLDSWYIRWYPEHNQFVKLVPRDIEITPLVLLNWFMDDGSSSYRKRLYRGVKQVRKNQVKITFCTECFTLDDQIFLRDEINRKYNLKCIVTPVKNSFRLKIPQSKTLDFFNIIGSSPVESMKYKWKNWELE